MSDSTRDRYEARPGDDRADGRCGTRAPMRLCLGVKAWRNARPGTTRDGSMPSIGIYMGDDGPLSDTRINYL